MSGSLVRHGTTQTDLCGPGTWDSSILLANMTSVTNDDQIPIALQWETLGNSDKLGPT